MIRENFDEYDKQKLKEAKKLLEEVEVYEYNYGVPRMNGKVNRLETIIHKLDILIKKRKDKAKMKKYKYEVWKSCELGGDYREATFDTEEQAYEFVACMERYRKGWHWRVVPVEIQPLGDFTDPAAAAWELD